jgi:peptidase A4-like protein
MESRRRLRRGFLFSTFIVLAITMNADAPIAARRFTSVALHRHDPIKIHHIRDGQVSSTNWSGYAVTGAAGTVTDVKGSWVVPAIQGSCPSTNEYASFWVGIDGYSSNTVEQIGTDSDCQNGKATYYAWYEFYPHPAFLISGMTIVPGDTIAAETRYDASHQRFIVSLTNLTRSESFTYSAKVKGAQRSSAEWIAEAPSGSGGILPLADFGTISYGFDTTGVLSTSDATVSGSTGPIGSFTSSIQQITMVTSSGATKAQPTSLSSDGTSFSDLWVSAGP